LSVTCDHTLACLTEEKLFIRHHLKLDVKGVRGMVNVCLFAGLHCACILTRSSAEEFGAVTTYTGITKKLCVSASLQMDCFVSELLHYLVCWAS